MPKCRGCKAEIIFIRTARGRSMPCDPTKFYGYVTDAPAESEDRLMLIDASDGRIRHGFKASNLTPGARYIEGHVSHFATCPKATRFKR